MAATPQFAATPIAANGKLTTANANKDGLTGTYATLFTAPATGVRIDDLTITATGTTTAGLIRLFVVSGGVGYLIREIPIQAVTPSGTVQGFAITVSGLRLLLASGEILKASTVNAESFDIKVTNGGAL